MDCSATRRAVVYLILTTLSNPSTPCSAFESMTLDRSMAVHHDDVNSIVFRPDGALVATGGKDHYFRLMDAEQWALLTTQSSDAGSARLRRFSPDGRFLFVSGYYLPTAFLDNHLWQLHGQEPDQYGWACYQIFVFACCLHS